MRPTAVDTSEMPRSVGPLQTRNASRDGYRSIVSLRLAIAVLLFPASAVLFGCQERWDVSPSGAPTVAPAAVEASFADQAAAVRAARSDTIQLDTDPLDDLQLEEAAALANLRALILDGGLRSAATIERLAGMAGLEHLRIRETAIDDAGARHLAGLRNLRIVNLPQAVVTDEGLRVLASLPKLELLRLGSPNVTDAGIAAIAESTTLLRLHLIGTPITDASLVSIQGMTQLQSFYLDGSQVTDEGMSQLIRARPDLHFHKDQQHRDYDPQRHSHLP